MLRTVEVNLGSFGVTASGDRHDHVVLGDEVFHRHVTIEGNDLCATVVTVLCHDLSQLLTDDRALTLRRGQDGVELIDHRLQLVMAVNELLTLECGQTTQLHVEDRLRLKLIDAQQLDQPVASDLNSGRGPNQGYDLVQGVKGLEEPAQDVSLFLCLTEAEGS